MKYPALKQLRSSVVAFSACLLAMAILPVPNAAAIDGTWIGNVSGTWSDAAMWVSGTVPGGAESTVSITAAVSPSQTVTINNTPRTVGTLNIGSTVAGSNRSFTVNSSGTGTLTFTNTSNAQLNVLSTTNGDTITAPILLGSSLDISNSGTNTAAQPITLTLGGTGVQTISSATIGTKTITNMGSGTGRVWLKNVTDGAGVVAVRQNSATSTMILGTIGGNSFSGGFILDAGTVFAGITSDAFGSGLIQLNAGTVNTSSSGRTTIKFNAIQIGGNVTFLDSTSGTGYYDLSSVAMTLTGDREITVGQSVVNLFGTAAVNSTLGESGGSRSFTKLGAGTFALSSYGLTTYTGGTVIKEGIFSILGVGNHLADSGAVTVDGGTFSIGVNTNETVGAVSLVNGAITGDSGNTLTGSSYAVESGSISAKLAGAGVTFAKSTSGTVTLSGANTYTGATTVSLGTLLINGSGASAVTVSTGAVLAGSGTVGGAVVIDSGATLAGTLRGGAVTGAGTVGPGNSPGIATFASADLDLGMDFKFELTAVGNPTWSAGGGNSVNDVLHLTAASPILGTADSDNVFDIYFSSTAPGAYVGGMFTDTNSDFKSLLTGVTYNFWVLNDANGGMNGYNGHFYDSISSGLVTVSTFQVGSANFADGTIANGWSQEFTVVPEPSTCLLVGLSLGTVLFFRRKRLGFRG